MTQQRNNKLSQGVGFACLLLVPHALSGCAALQKSSRTDPVTLVIRNVTVIDATGAPAKAGMSVFITGERITAIAPSAAGGSSAGAQVIEGTGRFLIPVLRDMHVHLGSYEEARGKLAGLLAAGVVGVREMASPPDGVLKLRAEIADGRLIVAGPIVQGPLPFDTPPLIRTVATPKDAAALVAELSAQGVDFIKTGDTLRRDLFEALAAEANRRRIPFAGHVPAYVDAAIASDLGQRSIEHFGSARFHGLLLACSREQADLSRIVRDTLTAAFAGGPAPESVLFKDPFLSRLVGSYDPAKAAALFRRFAHNGTWHTPTLTAVRQVWDAESKKQTDAEKATAGRVLVLYETMLRGLRDAGVRLLAGSDFDREGAIAVHDELARLVMAGLSPMEALQTATRNPAEFLGRLKTEGTIEAGKRADVVLLQANPLEQIENIRRVHQVVMRGRAVDR